MNSEERWKLYESAVREWGEGAQIDMVGEECSELVTEIFHYWRGRSDETDLAEEAADVEVMLEQLRVVLGDEMIDTAKDEKLYRLKDRLREEDVNV